MEGAYESWPPHTAILGSVISSSKKCVLHTPTHPEHPQHYRMSQDSIMVCVLYVSRGESSSIEWRSQAKAKERERERERYTAGESKRERERARERARAREKTRAGHAWHSVWSVTRLVWLIHLEEPYIFWKEHNIFLTGPYISWKEPYIFWREPCQFWKEPYIFYFYFCRWVVL